MQSVNNNPKQISISPVFGATGSIASGVGDKVENVFSSTECITTNASDKDLKERDSDCFSSVIEKYSAKRSMSDPMPLFEHSPVESKIVKWTNTSLLTVSRFASPTDLLMINIDDLKGNLNKNEVKLLNSIINHDFKPYDTSQIRGFIDYFGLTINEFTPFMEEEDFIKIIFMHPKGNWHLKMKESIKTIKTYQLLLQNEIIELIDIPEIFREPRIYEFLCKQKLGNISLVPEHMLTPAFIKSIYPYQVPFSDSSDNLALLKVIACPSLYLNASNKIKTEIKNHHLSYAIFEIIPSSEKTAELCSKAIMFDPCSLVNVPEDRKTFDLCLCACKISPWAIKYIPRSFRKNQINEIYLAILSNDPKAHFFIPDMDIRLEHYLYACRKLPLHYIYDMLCSIPKRLSVEEVAYLYHHVGLPIPESSANDHNNDNERDEEINRASTLNKEHIERYLKGEIKFIKKCKQYELLRTTEIPNESKMHLIKHLQRPYQEVSSVFINPTSYDGPLISGMSFPILDALVEKSYIYIDFFPKNVAVGNILLKAMSEIKAKIYDGSIAELLLQYPTEVTGGRAIKISRPSLKPIYVKFLKQNESFIDFKMEYEIYRAIRENKSLFSQFKSEIPIPKGLTCLTINKDLQKLLVNFDDPIFLQENNGQLEGIVYVYEASDDYSIYAHTLIDNDPTKAEKAIISACSDSGLLSSWGIMLTNTLPAFHDTQRGRRWVPLFSAFTFIECCHPGTFGEWNTDATERVDYGYSGIRDIGDFQIMGKITTCLTQKDTCAHLHPHNVSQRLAYCNTLVELLLSAVLVRSRLFQQLESYEYTNRDCIDKTSDFIKKLFNNFFTHLIYNEESKPEEDIFKDLLGLSDDDYEEWINRTSKEIVYWTQDQFRNGGSYLKNIRENKELTKELYSTGRAEGFSGYQVEKFFSHNKKLNLGRNNALFPLISLMNGLTLACSNLLSKNNQA